MSGYLGMEAVLSNNAKSSCIGIQVSVGSTPTHRAYFQVHDRIGSDWIVLYSHKPTTKTQGRLILQNRNGSIIWSSKSSTIAQNPVAQLLNQGNLVVKNGNYGNRENYLWQSFDYPCDTLLPHMKLGRNTETGLDRYLQSWKSKDDPSPGTFTYRLDPNGYPQFFVRNGSVDLFRSGPWNGMRFSGRPDLKSDQFINYSFVLNEKEMYFIYEPANSSYVLRMVLDQNGTLDRFIWVHQYLYWYRSDVSMDKCDSYAVCGPYGSCYSGNSFSQCECLQGFVRKSMNNSEGCFRRTPLDCPSGGRDGLLKHYGVKLPDTRNSSRISESMSIEECKRACLKDCSCMACANSDITGEGSGCLLWFGDLIDIRTYTEGGQDIYVRVASSEIGQVGSNRKKRVRIIGSSVLAGVLLLGLGLALYIWRKWKPSKQGERGYKTERHYTTETQKEDLELPLFDFATVANATNNFSAENKLGEGGFGPVYKGVLEEGQEIAVKRLSKNSKQGLDEFMNEVLCIAKLQHRNLVKLIGCCIQEEKMLIYEYMPNKSLDFFIFDGVLVLEIVSGKKNRRFHHPDHQLNLLGHAWRLYREGKSLELIDALIEDSCNLNEVLRSIHMGLLCVQKRLEDRPSMSSVVLMLSSESTLAEPKQPGFFTERCPPNVNSSSSKHEASSINEMSITLLDAR
ncbi:hypothetical protein L1049_001413 [Liquidambar formosana]|uniref:non-specific serine/threonine protein kinase n=1 Tax=Liquidambar formosana TaxID=63359 RepID=A0AAP0NCC5_LIQFO